METWTMNTKQFIGGAIGTSLSAVGTATQMNEVLQTISLIITIAGGFVSLVLIPLLSWYSKAKKDGKITTDELEEGAKLLGDSLEDFKKSSKREKGDKE